MEARNIQRVHAADGVWEEEIGVISRRKLTKASAAVDSVLNAIHEARDKRHTPGQPVDDERDLASAVVERLITEGFLSQ